jgi:amino acid transporter/nucleotide-binding universal stress UspA family protein
MTSEINTKRTIGLVGATGIGVGAIVGGGILALAGVAFSATGPGAVVAFGLNGLIAIITALSFAEMSAAFPESGGTYTFAKKVVSVRAAFMVGWVVWFASVVAAVLYAIGFASFALIIIEHLWRADYGIPPAWMLQPQTVTALAVAATILYTLSLLRQNSGGGQLENIGKVAVFIVLIAGGIWALSGQTVTEIKGDLTPFFPGGAAGLIQAMGFTFIALQGFDLIAAVAGEVRDPGRTIPRAMFGSLGIALAIYIPLLLIIATVGVPAGQTVTAMSRQQPEAVIAVGVQNYLGQSGYWLVMVAAVLSMLSALRANLYAASRVAMTMARDRTLPYKIGMLNPVHATPVNAVLVTALLVVLLLLMLRNVAAAGAASSLIFLLTFAIAHGLSIKARRRRNTGTVPFQVPWFPVVPVIGIISCMSLAIFQGMTVSSAGIIAALWLSFGGILYLVLFSRRARVVDAAAQAMDPELMRLRGRSPLVLVPIANPVNAEAMVNLANALSPPKIGRVLLLTVVRPDDTWEKGKYPQPLIDAQAVLREALTASFAAGLSPEALTTIATPPWAEIRRVARIHRCESLLLGLSNLDDETVGTHLEDLMNTVNCDVVVLRARPGWQLKEVQRVLVPVAGRRTHNELRARLLSSLWRTQKREITFLQVLSEHLPEKAHKKACRDLFRFAQDEIPGHPKVKVIYNNSASEEIIAQASESDLLILGLNRMNRRRKVFGSIARGIINETRCTIIMIGERERQGLTAQAFGQSSSPTTEKNIY